MPNIKQQKKRVRKSEEQHLRNRSVKSSVKTDIKKFEGAFESGDREEAEKAYLDAARSLDKAATKGVIHKNRAANSKSRMARLLNQMK